RATTAIAAGAATTAATAVAAATATVAATAAATGTGAAASAAAAVPGAVARALLLRRAEAAAAAAAHATQACAHDVAAGTQHKGHKDKRAQRDAAGQNPAAERGAAVGAVPLQAGVTRRARVADVVHDGAQEEEDGHAADKVSKQVHDADVDVE